MANASTKYVDETSYDVIIIGSGVSGSYMALALTRAGARCLMLEAGSEYGSKTFPRNEMDANSRLYWSGGVELSHRADLACLRAKCVGGGSVVNQALLDRFDDDAFDSWKAISGIPYFSTIEMASWYEMAEKELVIQEIPEKHRNRNAQIFKQGFDQLGYKCAPLKRAQSNCRYEDGNDCIECLSGCRVMSKQSMPWTTLKKAKETGKLTLVPDFQVTQVMESSEGMTVVGVRRQGGIEKFSSGKVVLAAGAIGNTLLLLKSGYGKKLPALGRGFYSHPQFMNFGVYNEPVRAHKGPFQALKSSDLHFRKAGFKLENVFGGPVGLSMLAPGIGRDHQKFMEKMPYMACIEVAIRDTEPGRIQLKSNGQPLITKIMNAEDLRRKAAGMRAIRLIFEATGAKQVIEGQFGLGLHLMGGCSIGSDPKTSCTSPEFSLHGFPKLFAADSSIFPNAPGINPSLTIMALSLRAAKAVLK